MKEIELKVIFKLTKIFESITEEKLILSKR